MSAKMDEHVKIMSLLERGHLAHLGCHSEEEVYVIPITYALEKDYLYSHSRNGKKIEMMRKNPNICIQVEEVRGLFDWDSVVVQGVYEELTGDDAARGMRLLIKNIAQQERVPSLPELEVDFAAMLQTAIIFRLKINKVFGRHEGADTVINY